jgi:hypothetical protein
MKGQLIVCIPADNNGNKLWLKDFRVDDNKVSIKYYIKYKSTYNDLPFEEVEIFLVDKNKNFVITGDDGTILFRFFSQWINKLV